MPHFYRLTTEGEETNLQLYALRRANKEWERLEAAYATTGSSTEKLRERCVFLLATLGLSISQLLGQNVAHPTNTVKSPLELFKDLVQSTTLSRKRKKRLTDRFILFNYFYNGCRHFGRTVNGKAYKKVEQLTYSRTRSCFHFGLSVWRLVLDEYRVAHGADLSGIELDDVLAD